MAQDRLQLQRFELKYVVSESVALAARDFVRNYLELDENGAGKPQLSYAIHSLYLDSEDLTLYAQTINGDKNRFKLRLRYYHDGPADPVFFEIKRRNNEAILKQRAAVRRDAVHRILAGQLPEPEHLISNEPRHLTAMQNFSRLMLRLHARPKAHVTYWREAWLSRGGNSVRVTMDRDVRFEAEPTAHLSTQMRRPIRAFGAHVILEIKFTGHFPVWLSEMTRVFGLNRRSAAKYADGVALVGEDHLQRELRMTSMTFPPKPVLARVPGMMEIQPAPNSKFL